VGEIERESVNPKLSPNNIFEEYSMPSFDVDRRPAYVLGKDMLSSRLKIQRSSLLINKLNVRQQRIWLVETPSENAICSSEFMPFVSEMVNLEFLREFFLSNETTKKLEELSTGTSNSQNRVSPKDIINFKLAIPTLPEQEAIGTFFSTLDRHITLHQRKLDKLKNVKQAYLSEMFPAEGERVPKRRFPGFTDAWELRKLKELADFSKGLGYTKNDLTESGNPIILYGRLYTKYQTVIDNVDTFVDVKDKSVVSIGGEVIVPSSGESSEDIARASVVDNAGVILGGDLNVIKPKDEIDSTFLALTISNGQQQKELSKRAQGKSVVHLHNSDLKEVNLIFPSIDEQKQIGELFKGIENTITLHQRKS
jgi:type I restriction enzyme S subunit